MKSLFLLALLPLLAQAQTFTPSCSAVITCQPLVAPTPPVVTPPPPSGVTWMYLNGVKTLAGDFTGGGETTNYQNSTGSGKDILITSTVPWGYFIPYWAANYRLPNPGYTYLLLNLKPSITGDTFGIHAERVGDSPLPGVELITATGSSYGPAAVKGVWGTYKIPLKDLGVLGDATLYKIVMATHTAAADSWELDAIGFQ